MADDVSNSNSEKSLDLDNLRITVLLIVKSVTQFGAITQFLERRNWKTIVVTSMDDAIKGLAKHQPEFVFVSYNHPNPKLLKLPTILAQTFNTHCVGFCETPDLRTESKLTSSKIKYKLVGAASGPSIFRRVKQILAEEMGYEDKSENTSISNNNLSNENIESIKIKGGNNETQEKKGLAYIPKGEEEGNKNVTDLFKKLQEALKNEEEKESLPKKSGNFGASEETQTNMDLEKEMETEGNPFKQNHSKEDHNETSEVNKAPGTIKRDERGDLEKETLSTKGKLHLIQSEKKEGKIINLTMPPKIKSDDENLDFGYEKEKTELNIEKGNKTKSHLIIQEGASSENNIPLLKESKEQNEFMMTQESELTKSENNIATGTEEGPTMLLQKNNLKGEDQFLFEAIRKTLLQFRPADNQEDIDFKRLKRIGVIPINNENINGYIMVASTVSANLRAEKLNSFYKIFKKEIFNENKKLMIHQEFTVNTIEVDIIDWTERMGDLAIIERVGRGYVAAAFIRTEYKVPNLIVDQKREKLIVPLETIVADSELKFNAYIYMDKNEKFLTYGKGGRSLSEKQINKLKEKEQNLYIKPEDAEEFKKYFAQNVINDLIEFYLKRDIEKVG
jgi:hypothetical protein